MVSPKRRFSSTEDEGPDTKRSKIDTTNAPLDLRQAIVTLGAENYEGDHGLGDGHPIVSCLPNAHFQSRQAIQRSIALVLSHDGFESTTPEAMESFTQLVETYLDSIIRETKKFALASRRDLPCPVDFERMLHRHNVSVSSLKQHLRPPISATVIRPSYRDAWQPGEDELATLPLLDQELSGEADKDSKLYIPISFPDFPSKHTYKFTPQEDINIRDSKKVREQAARTAQHGEDALRRLVRASKIRKQKEVKSIVEKDDHGKERFRLWELTMKKFMDTESRGEATDQLEIADHSMIVNGDAVYHRKEITRIGKRGGALSKTNGVV